MLLLPLQEVPDCYTEIKLLLHWALIEESILPATISDSGIRLFTKDGQHYQQHEDTQPNQDSGEQEKTEVHQGWI